MARRGAASVGAALEGVEQGRDQPGTSRVDETREIDTLT